MLANPRLTLVDTCQIGSYLTCYTESAAVHIEEQLSKRSAYLSNQFDSFIEILFEDINVTPGIYAHRLEKCKKLAQSFYVQFAEDENKALKEFAFSLRNILFYSEFKEIIRELEKKTSPYKDFSTYQTWVKEKFILKKRANDFTLQRYRKLYYFIRQLNETSRYLTKIDQPKRDLSNTYLDYSMFLEEIEHDKKLFTDPFFIPSNTNQAIENKLSYYLTKHSCTYKQFLHYFYYRIIFSEPCELATLKDDALAVYIEDETVNGLLFFNLNTHILQLANSAIFMKENIRIFDLMEQYPLPLTQLETLLSYYIATLKREEIEQFIEQCIQPTATFQYEMQKMIASNVVNYVVAQYISQSTSWLKATTTKQPIKVESKKVQKVTAKQPSDKQWQKQLQLEQDEKQHALQLVMTADDTIAKLEKQLADAKAEIFTLQQQAEEYEELLQLADETPPVTENAKNIVQEMHELLGQLQQELAVEIVEDEPMDESYLQKIEHLKIAVVGGHQKYHSQLKNKFKQDLLTITPDKLNFNATQLTTYDVIVISTGYMNHSLYERTFDRLKKANLKSRALILDTQPNAERLAKEIFDFLAMQK